MPGYDVVFSKAVGEVAELLAEAGAQHLGRAASAPTALDRQMAGSIVRQIADRFEDVQREREREALRRVLRSAGMGRALALVDAWYAERWRAARVGRRFTDLWRGRRVAVQADGDGRLFLSIGDQCQLTRIEVDDSEAEILASVLGGRGLRRWPGLRWRRRRWWPWSGSRQSQRAGDGSTQVMVGSEQR